LRGGRKEEKRKGGKVEARAARIAACAGFNK